MQRKLRGKSCGDGGGGSLDVGSMVLARYSVDKVMYRAKVEEVMEGNEKLIRSVGTFLLLLINPTVQCKVF